MPGGTAADTASVCPPETDTGRVIVSLTETPFREVLIVVIALTGRRAGHDQWRTMATAGRTAFTVALTEIPLLSRLVCLKVWHCDVLMVL